MRMRATLTMEYDTDQPNDSEEAATKINAAIRNHDAELDIEPILAPPVPLADIAELRQAGVIQEMNRLILHPLGLALEVRRRRDGSETLSGIWDCREDPEGVIFDEGYASAEKASELADLIEMRGVQRRHELGYVIQPFPPEVKQLTTRVLEDSTVQVAPPGEFDEGEERPA